MRLIDADALIEEIVHVEDLRRLSTATIGKALDAVPTIDAIPVEWLRQYQSKMPNISAVMGVDVLLMMWQKEQEAR